MVTVPYHFYERSKKRDTYIDLLLKITTSLFVGDVELVVCSGILSYDESSHFTSIRRPTSAFDLSYQLHGVPKVIDMECRSLKPQPDGRPRVTLFMVGNGPEISLLLSSSSSSTRLLSFSIAITLGTKTNSSRVSLLDGAVGFFINKSKGLLGNSNESWYGRCPCWGRRNG